MELLTLVPANKETAISLDVLMNVPSTTGLEQFIQQANILFGFGDAA